MDEFFKKYKKHEDQLHEVIEKMTENEVNFLTEEDYETNEHGVFVYTSTNGVSKIELSLVLLSYKQWLLDNKIVKYVD
jgi:hypothetical protein